MRKKSLALLLVLTMLATLFVGVVPASATTTWSVLAVPTLTTGAAVPTGVGAMQLSFDTLNTGTSKMVVSFPNADWQFNQPTVVVAAYESSTVGAAITPVTAFLTAGDAGYWGKKEFRLEITASAPCTGVQLLINTSNVYVPSDADAEVHVAVTALTGQAVGADLVVAKTSSGACTAWVEETKTFGESGLAAGSLNISVRENVYRALKIANPTIKFTLPSGYTWSGTPNVTQISTGNNVVGASLPDFVPTITGNANKDFAIQRITAGGVVTAKDVFRFTAGITVNSAVAKFGEVTVDLGGDSSYSPGSLVIGTYTDYGIDVTASEVKDVKAGRVDQKLGKFIIKEKAANSIVGGRSISLMLPAGAKWATIPSPTVTGGLSVGAAGITGVGTDGREAKFTVANTGSKGDMTFENCKVDLAVDFTGDLKVTVGGSAGVTGEAIVGKTAAALTATVTDAPDIKIGMQSQAGSTITLTEGFKEALINNKNLTVTAPTGVEWSAVPTVTVKSGNVEVDTVSKNANVLTIVFKSTSSTPSVIEISDVKFTVNRSVPEGPIEVKVQGEAVDESNDTAVVGALTRSLYTIPTSNKLFSNNDVAAKAIVGKCVTPAPDQQKVTASFTIGSTTYKANGIDQTMDVAPYIMDGRTFMPLRYVAYAMGVSAENVIWDDSAKTVTLMKGDKVVQVKIGSTTMLANGIAITMDVAPEIKDGRTMLPLRFLANAFGATTTWDAATNTATIN